VEGNERSSLWRQASDEVRKALPAEKAFFWQSVLASQSGSPLIGFLV